MSIVQVEPAAAVSTTRKGGARLPQRPPDWLRSAAAWPWVGFTVVPPRCVNADSCCVGCCHTATGGGGQTSRQVTGTHAPACLPQAAEALHPQAMCGRIPRQLQPGPRPLVAALSCRAGGARRRAHCRVTSWTTSQLGRVHHATCRLCRSWSVGVFQCCSQAQPDRPLDRAFMPSWAPMTYCPAPTIMASVTPQAWRENV